MNSKSINPYIYIALLKIDGAFVTAIISSICSILLFYPGFMSPDSAYQWYQVRSGVWDNVHPVIMTLLWSATNTIKPGPGGLFILQTLVYWLGVWFLATGLFQKQGHRVAAILLIGYCPPLWALSSYLWKDVWMMVLSLWATGFLVHDLHSPKRVFRILALLCLILACSFRYNALPLILPFLWYLIGREGFRIGIARHFLITGIVFVIIAFIAILPNHLPGVIKRQVWPVTMIWDLCTVSVKEQKILLPGQIIFGDLKLSELSNATLPIAAAPVFSLGKIKDPTQVSYTSEENRVLRSAWWQMIKEHPLNYLLHRLHVSSLLFGFNTKERPASIVMTPALTNCCGNPEIKAKHPYAIKIWYVFIYVMMYTPIFSVWLYGLLAFAGMLLSIWRKQKISILSWSLLASAFLYAAPLIIVSPGIDFRFVLWPILAFIIVFILEVFGNQKIINRDKQKPES
jgi:hypothetical protein